MLTDRPKSRMFEERSRLTEFAGKSLRLICPGCRHVSEVTATQLMIHRGGAARVAEVLASMRCESCRRRGTPEIEIG